MFMTEIVSFHKELSLLLLLCIQKETASVYQLKNKSEVINGNTQSKNSTVYRKWLMSDQTSVFDRQR